MKKLNVFLFGMLVVGMISATWVQADESAVITITIKDHQFIPSRVDVKAGQPFVLVVKNDDATPEEFESKSLRREKIIPGNKSAKIKFDALPAGEYPFVGEYHEDVTKGVLVVQ